MTQAGYGFSCCSPLRLQPPQWYLRTTARKFTPTTSSEVKSPREKVLHALFSGASKVSRLLQTRPAPPSARSREYHAMTKWWCDDGGKLVAKLAESSLCQSRGRVRKRWPEERKKATGEARSMLQHY